MITEKELIAAMEQALNRLDEHAVGRAREVLLEALGKVEEQPEVKAMDKPFFAGLDPNATHGFPFTHIQPLQKP